MNIKKLTFMAVLCATAVILHTAEAQLPPFVPVPGVKSGISNIVTLIAMMLLGRKDAFYILLCRLCMGWLISGNTIGAIYGCSGALLCFTIESLLIKKFNIGNIWILSVIGAILHNLGQIIVACIITKTYELMWYMIILTITGAISGFITGIISRYTLLHGKGIIEKMMKAVN